MKHKKKRISKIVDELINYFFTMGATNIDISVKEETNQYIIHFKSNYSTDINEKINKLIKYLESPKQEEMEEYYWELAGDSDVDTELTLVGMMTDKVDIDINDNIIEISLYRYK